MHTGQEASAQTRERRTLLASVAALGSLFAALSCCLPVWPFMFAAGAATGSAVLFRLRPYLLALSVGCILFGFYQSWRARQCQAKPRLMNTILLWFSAAVVIASILFPQALANLLAG